MKKWVKNEGGPFLLVGKQNRNFGKRTHCSQPHGTALESKAEYNFSPVKVVFPLSTFIK